MPSGKARFSRTWERPWGASALSLRRCLLMVHSTLRGGVGARGRDLRLGARCRLHLGYSKAASANILKRLMGSTSKGGRLMDVVAATKDFETWVRRHIPVVQNQLSDKHKLMAERPVQFLRGTFYRWAQLFPEVCPELNKAPAVLAVGDLHMASFGTWRDAFGRLI